MRIAWFTLLSPLAILAQCRQAPSSYPTGSLAVKTETGTYYGLINGTSPQVRQFLGIPYAQPPTKERRWMPPKKLNTRSTDKVNATRQPPSCPQYITPLPNIFNQVVPEFLINGPRSEDCLSLSVWTPLKARGLPVIVFITGGGFTTGGVDIDYQLPYHWVQRTQAHVAVTINYRLNIMGFPNAAGLEDQNLGILDQRAALEWVRDNIEAFGGDASKITLWGQSAGGASVDYHKFAYYEDPIVSGYYGASGTVYLGISSADTQHTNFTYVARQVGCHHPDNSTTQLACMRQVLWEDIIAAAGPGLNDNNTLSFYPFPDDKIIFSNYTERYQQGKIADRPAIFSTNQNEGAVVAPFNRSGINTTIADQATKDLFVCPAAQTTRLRGQSNLTTYRFEYSGNFSNVSPLPWMGAYHDAELPMFFGTHRDYLHGKGPSTRFQMKTSKLMQDMLLAFMNDPYEGAAKAGWIESRSGKMLRYGANGKAVQGIGIESVDGICS